MINHSKKHHIIHDYDGPYKGHVDVITWENLRDNDERGIASGLYDGLIGHGGVGHAAMRITFPKNEVTNDLLESFSEENGDEVVITSSLEKIPHKDEFGNYVFDEETGEMMYDFVDCHVVYWSWWNGTAPDHDESEYLLGNFTTDCRDEGKHINFSWDPKWKQYLGEDSAAVVRGKFNPDTARVVEIGPKEIVVLPEDYAEAVQQDVTEMTRLLSNQLKSLADHFAGIELFQIDDGDSRSKRSKKKKTNKLIRKAKNNFDEVLELCETLSTQLDNNLEPVEQMRLLVKLSEKLNSLQSQYEKLLENALFQNRYGDDTLEVSILAEVIDQISPYMDLTTAEYDKRYKTQYRPPSFVIDFPLSYEGADWAERTQSQDGSFNLEAMLNKMHDLLHDDEYYNLGIKSCCSTVGDILDAGARESTYLSSGSQYFSKPVGGIVVSPTSLRQKALEYQAKIANDEQVQRSYVHVIQQKAKVILPSNYFKSIMNSISHTVFRKKFGGAAKNKTSFFQKVKKTGKFFAKALIFPVMLVGLVIEGMARAVGHCVKCLSKKKMSYEEMVSREASRNLSYIERNLANVQADASIEESALAQVNDEINEISLPEALKQPALTMQSIQAMSIVEQANLAVAGLKNMRIAIDRDQEDIIVFDKAFQDCLLALQQSTELPRKLREKIEKGYQDISTLMVERIRTRAQQLREQPDSFNRSTPESNSGIQAILTQLRELQQSDVSPKRNNKRMTQGYLHSKEQNHKNRIAFLAGIIVKLEAIQSSENHPQRKDINQIIESIDSFISQGRYGKRIQDPWLDSILQVKDNLNRLIPTLKIEQRTTR